MNLNIEFPPELEETLRHHAAAQGKDVEAFVRELVTDNLEDSKSLDTGNGTHLEFARRLEAWIALHPVLDHAVDDSRDSIYVDRGL